MQNKWLSRIKRYTKITRGTTWKSFINKLQKLIDYYVNSMPSIIYSEDCVNVCRETFREFMQKCSYYFVNKRKINHVSKYWLQVVIEVTSLIRGVHTMSYLSKTFIFRPQERCFFSERGVFSFNMLKTATQNQRNSTQCNSFSTTKRTLQSSCFFNNFFELEMLKGMVNVDWMFGHSRSLLNFIGWLRKN